MEIFPEAKVVLTVRDNPETWFESVKNSIYKAKNLHKFFPLNLYFWLMGNYNNMKMVTQISNDPIRGAKKGKSHLSKPVKTKDIQSLLSFRNVPSN